MAMARTVASATSRTTATATHRTTITATTIGHIAEDALAAVPWSPGDKRPRTTTLRLLLLLRCVGQGAHERGVSKIELKNTQQSNKLTFMAMARTGASATSRTTATATYRTTHCCCCVAWDMARTSGA